MKFFYVTTFQLDCVANKLFITSLNKTLFVQKLEQLKLCTHPVKITSINVRKIINTRVQGDQHDRFSKVSNNSAMTHSVEVVKSKIKSLFLAPRVAP